MKIIARGTIKRVHVDRRIMAQNKRDGTNLPALTIQTSKGSIKARRVKLFEPTELLQVEKPLSCGARAYIETRGMVGYI